MKVQENPLKIVEPKTPDWICKHPNAKVIDHEMKRFQCFICNTKNGRVRKISQEIILENIRKESV
jgi:hypothetical protein